MDSNSYFAICYICAHYVDMEFVDWNIVDWSQALLLKWCTIMNRCMDGPYGNEYFSLSHLHTVVFWSVCKPIHMYPVGAMRSGAYRYLLCHVIIWVYARIWHSVDEWMYGWTLWKWIFDYIMHIISMSHLHTVVWSVCKPIHKYPVGGINYGAYKCLLYHVII